MRLDEILDMTPVENACAKTKLEDGDALLNPRRDPGQMFLLVFAFQRFGKKGLSGIERIFEDFKCFELF